MKHLCRAPVKATCAQIDNAYVHSESSSNELIGRRISPIKLRFEEGMEMAVGGRSFESPKASKPFSLEQPSQAEMHLSTNPTLVTVDHTTTEPTASKFLFRDDSSEEECSLRIDPSANFNT
jgi:hypothetical protein